MQAACACIAATAPSAAAVTTCRSGFCPRRKDPLQVRLGILPSGHISG